MPFPVIPRLRVASDLRERTAVEGNCAVAVKRTGFKVPDEARTTWEDSRWVPSAQAVIATPLLFVTLESGLKAPPPDIAAHRTTAPVTPLP
jgi:hypothetical protein